MTAAFVERVIDVSFELGTGSFGESGSSSLKFSGLRVAVTVELAALPNTGPAVIRIYGMTLSQMNQLSKAGLVWEGRNNKVSVSAGDEISGMAVVFKGNMIEAYPDFTEAPNSAFVVFATPSNEAQLKPVKPVSFTGAVKTETAMSQIVKSAGWTLENNGVNTVLASPYFPGTVWQQALACARASDCFAHLDGVRNVLAIWPKNGSRSGDTALIAPETGMIGYPTFQQTQVKVRTVFDPSLKTGAGQKIRIKSQLEAANGTFAIIKVDHNLESQMPSGPWETLIEATPQK